MDLGGLPASLHIARLAARRAFAPGTREWRLSPSGPIAQPDAIGFKKAMANHVPIRIQKSPHDKRLFSGSRRFDVYTEFHPAIERFNHAAAFKRRGPRRKTDAD
jgi:hypothetical protein